MFKVIFTLDYEIHGNGDGDPYQLMVEPTWRLIRLLQKYKAKLTVFADVAQIEKFKSYYEKTGVDKFSYLKIKEQLEYCINNGHDVQLHIHSSFYNSIYNGQRWVQSWGEYNLAALDYNRIENYIRSGKDFLESFLRPIDPNYRCNVFRAANWSMQPSENILKALHKNGFIIDTSVYKWGKQTGNVSYDYTQAHSQLLPYPVSFKNINNLDVNSPIFEIPIYCEPKMISSFFTPIRVFRAIRALLHKHEKRTVQDNAREDIANKNKKSLTRKLKHLFFKRHPRKLDFNQLSAAQQIRVLKRIKQRYKDNNNVTPIVFIGHSKTFIKYNERIVNKVLFYLNQNKGFTLSTFQHIDIEYFRKPNEK
ncbi:MAG: hypothetical protein ACOCWC_03715 [Bacteroidota bacterium]